MHPCTRPVVATTTALAAKVMWMCRGGSTQQ
jgi:hypothetical protein